MKRVKIATRHYYQLPETRVTLTSHHRPDQ
jgi:hypothetical protein